MSSSLSEASLEKKFQAVTNTQDSIQTLSLWLLHHKNHHQKIVAAWMKILQKAKITHRLTMFYLANDVVQNSKRKGFLLFVNSFAEVLKEATLLVRDEHIRSNIQRVFNIWEQRNVYSPEFIADLRAILANSKVPSSAPSKLLADFKPEMVIKKLRGVMKLESETSTKTSSVNLSKLNATDAEIVQQLKDRTHGQQFKHDFDKNIKNLEELLELMTKEVEERNQMILLLEQSEIYYDTQRGEAKVVANAYKNFDGRVKALEKKLNELRSTFPSPVPSPCPDAPSPTTSDHELELSLPSDNKSLEDAPSPVGSPEDLNLSPALEDEKKLTSLSTTKGNLILTVSNFFSHELENLEDAPSPVGSPEGLNFPPAVEEEKKTTKPSTTKGNPIPSLSNFFSHEDGGMSSWLDAFSSQSQPSQSLISPLVNSKPQKKDPSSLDSRLSNLLQNIPNLPSGLQTTLFSNASSGNNTPTQDTSPKENTTKVKSSDPPPITGSSTPNKDDYSGQNTPLQDEDTHSSHAFFNKLASSNKSQSPKDILKGLTNFIQSATTEKEEAQRKEEPLIQPGQMSSFIQSIIPAISQSSVSPSSYFSSPQSVPIPALSTTSSYSSVSTYMTETTRDNNTSFIPSLVPSASHDAFSFPKEKFSSEEYNPEMELFNVDMELEDPDEDSNPCIPSPEPDPLLSPSVNDVRPRASIPGRRSSTLITVVTDDSTSGNISSSEMFSSDDMYKSDKENVTQELLPPWAEAQSVLENSSNPMMPANIMSSPDEEYFIGKTEANTPTYFSAPPLMMSPPNGENFKAIDTINDPLGRIETVQSHREDLNGRWFDNGWSENERRMDVPRDMLPPPHFRPSESEFFHHNQNFPPPPRNFQSRQSEWVPRFRSRNSYDQERNHPFSHRPYGQQPYKRFPFRGRGGGGWIRNPSQY